MTDHLRDILIWLGFSGFAWFSLSQVLHTDLLERSGRKPGKKVPTKSDSLGGGTSQSHFLYWAMAFLITLFGWMTLDGMRGYVRSPGIIQFPLAFCRYYTGWPPDLASNAPNYDDPNETDAERRTRLVNEGNSSYSPTTTAQQ